MEKFKESIWVSQSLHVGRMEGLRAPNRVSSNDMGRWLTKKPKVGQVIIRIGCYFLYEPFIFITAHCFLLIKPFYHYLLKSFLPSKPKGQSTLSHWLVISLDIPWPSTTPITAASPRSLFKRHTFMAPSRHLISYLLCRTLITTNL